LDLTDHTGVSPVALSGNSDSQSTGLPAFNVAAGDTFEVLPGQTLATVFGNSVAGSLVVTGSAGLSNADTIGFPTTSTGGSTSYYFKYQSRALGTNQQLWS